MEALRRQLQHLATFDRPGSPHVPTLLLLGETGTGKGLLARVMHDSGPRAHGPFIAVNCAAIPETLLEVELFGFTAGAFTDAKQAKPGLFEAASGGTLFLDEIEALPLSLQPKLLTAIEDKQVRRLGAVATHQVDVKFIAATKEALLSLVEAGRFRADLYHRLAVVELAIPPLRARVQDSLLLAQHYLQYYATAHQLQSKHLSTEAQVWLQQYPWPGNVRELRHLMERATLLVPGQVLEASTLAGLVPSAPPPVLTGAPPAVLAPDAATDEAMQIRRALHSTAGNVALAARRLGVTRNTLRYRMRRYAITRPQWEQLPTVPVSPPTAAPGAEPHVPFWEHKPVAALVLTLTFPRPAEDQPIRYDPWTLARRWQQTVAETIQAVDGVLLQHSPALCVGMFGLPRTQEHLAHRAVQAALALRHATSPAATSPAAEPCPILRCAVHLGQVLVDVSAPDLASHVLALGDTLERPMAMLGQARAGELLVSQTVQRAIAAQGLLQARPWPPDLAPPEEALYVVTGWRQTPLPGRTLSRFVGRGPELDLLHEALAQVEAGHGQGVGILGAPGIGKSRLVQEFRQRLQGTAVTYLEGHCVAYGQHTPYLPLRAILQQQCGVTDSDTAATVRHKVASTLHAVGLVPDDDAPYVLRLLGSPDAADQLAAASPDAVKLRTFTVLRRLSLLTSQQHPLILVIENLHWMDTVSEAYLTMLIEHISAARVLVLTTYRPGYRPPWVDKSLMSQLALRPLTPADSRRLVADVCRRAGHTLTTPEVLLVKAEGNPLFLEELTRVALAQPQASTLPVPETLQDVLMARIDRLAEPPRRLLHLAAILGRDVPQWLLAQLWQGPEALDTVLGDLQRLEWLSPCPDEAPELVYRFQHALTQDVAYASLPPPQRQALHAMAGRMLEERHATQLDAALEPLAYHYARSTETDKAVDYLTRQAERAVYHFAYVEAAALLEEALRHATQLPDSSRERRLLELSMQRAASLGFLGRFQEMGALLTPHGPYVKRCHEPRLTGPYYFQLGLMYTCLGDYAQGIAAAEQGVRDAQACGDPLTQGEALYVLCYAALAEGRLAQGVAYGQHALMLLEPTVERHWLATTLYVLALCHGGLGQFSAALTMATRFEALGKAQQDPHLQSHAALAIATVAALQGEWKTSVAAVQRCLALAPAALTASLAHLTLGHAYVEKGDAAQARAVLEPLVERFGATRFAQGESRAAALLSEAYLLAGDLPQAQAMAQHSLGVSRHLHYSFGSGVAQRALGRIEATQGQAPHAWEHLQSALQLFTTLQAQGEQGRTHLALAALALQQQDQQRGLAALREAYRLFIALDMPAYGARVLRLAEAHAIPQTTLQ